MNCAEFQKTLPDYLEGERSADESAHVRHCEQCSGLVADLKAISEQARMLQATEEPSPRVWNSIEIVLRQEGLIRQPQREPVRVARPAGFWRAAWLAPLAAGFALTFGVLYYTQRPTPEVAKAPTDTVTATDQTQQTAQDPTPQAAAMDEASDQRVLDLVASRQPAMRADYAANLTTVNNYIRDARMGVDADPNDEEAQRSLMEAYQQKEMVYDMALDHSLP
jgi:hypothetical protein